MAGPPVAALSVAAALAVYMAMAPARAADTVTFTDVTKASGITFSHVSSPDKKYILESMSGGVAVFDFDKDGLLDIYLVNSPTVASAGDARAARSELWRNRGDGTFADVTDKAGVGYPGWGMGAVAADFDNDGWNDLVCDLLRSESPLSQQRRRNVHGRHREGGRRRSPVVDRRGVRRLRPRRLARPVRGQLRRRAARRVARVRQGQVL